MNTGDSLKTKLAIAIATSLASASIAVSAATTVSKPLLAKDSFPAVSEKASVNSNLQKAVFIPEKNLTKGKYRYFIRLTESPVALYKGGIENLKATQVKHGKLNTKNKSVKAYRSFLNKQQDTVINKANALIGKLDIKQQTTLAYNGMVVEMTQDDAIKLASIPGIAHIHREVMRYPTTDVGPQFIKADGVWDGSATGTASKGEGIIVGIIDTGINTDHPAFADVGGDEFDHTNPWGEGVYSGDCATEEWASLCNDKLIGVHSYPVLTNMYDDYDPDVAKNGEDHNGHGSHVAGTAAGNLLKSVDASDGLILEQTSGVAPHANIVSYQVCLPGEQDAIDFRGCFPSLAVLSVEHAIENGVDVLNYSVGGGSSDPWQDPDALAFLAARQAGIHVATSAGNSGPGPETVGSPGDAPWITSVAAATHNRDIVRNVTVNDNDYSYTKGSGPSFTMAVEGQLKYAGTVDADNVEGCSAFSDEAFADSIALISRGSCSFEDKVVNATNAGATAVIVHNNRDGDETLVMANLAGTTVPSVMISENSGAAVVSALADDTSLTATINLPSVIETEGGAIADFSSRGSNASVPDVIAPSISAPGVRIFAPYADDQSAGFKESPDPSDYGFLNGTSMASPHIAGALAILADVQPSWSPAALQSALMLTANQETLSHDETPATFFDMGAGMANVAAAAQSGLILEETFSGYMNANPNAGGKPSAINLATMANANCVDTCSWTRTVTATKSGDWTVASSVITEGLVISVTPESFSLTAGQTQEVTITANVAEASEGWNFANIVLTAEGMPEAKMPIAVKANGNNLPDSIDIVAPRASGSLTLPSFQAKDMSGIEIAAYDKVTALIEPATLSVPEDSFDFIAVTFDEDLPNVIFQTTASTAPDVDMRVFNSSFAVLGVSEGPTQFESLSFENLPAGTYYVAVYGYRASTPGGTDPVTVEISSILFDDASLSDIISADVVEKETDFDIKLTWKDAENVNGYFAVSSDENDDVKVIPYSITRVDSDVEATIPEDIQPGVALEAGQAQELSFVLEPNFSSEDKAYTLSASVTGDHEFTDISHGGVFDGGTVTWNITRLANAAGDTINSTDDDLEVTFNLVPRKSGDDYELTLTNALDGDVQTISTQFDVAEAAPVAIVNVPARVVEGELVELDATASFDANGDDISFLWAQRSGSPVSFGETQQKPSFVVPGVRDGEVMTFDLVVTDANGNTDETTVSFSVVNSSSSGGAMGYLLLMLLPLIGLRRRFK